MNIHVVIDKLPRKAAVITSIFIHFPIPGLHSPRFDSDTAPCYELVTPTNLKIMYQNETRRECLLAILKQNQQNVIVQRQQKSTSQKTSENPCFQKNMCFHLTDC